QHFCSVLGPTFPNRYYLLAGTSFGHVDNTLPDLSGAEWTQRTIFNLLDEAQPPISWKIYFSDLPFAALFGYVRARLGTNAVPINQFAVDAAAGALPQVAFIDPSFVGEMENDEHPPTNIQLGQALVAGIINSAMTSPQWSRLALFLTYDEHGGVLDHGPRPAPSRVYSGWHRPPHLADGLPGGVRSLRDPRAVRRGVSLRPQALRVAHAD